LGAESWMNLLNAKLENYTRIKFATNVWTDIKNMPYKQVPVFLKQVFPKDHHCHYWCFQDHWQLSETSQNWFSKFNNQHELGYAEIIYTSTY
jgi:hypothetical protein